MDGHVPEETDMTAKTTIRVLADLKAGHLADENLNVRRFVWVTARAEEYHYFPSEAEHLATYDLKDGETDHKMDGLPKDVMAKMLDILKEARQPSPRVFRGQWDFGDWYPSKAISMEDDGTFFILSFYKEDGLEMLANQGWTHCGDTARLNCEQVRRRLQALRRAYQSA